MDHYCHFFFKKLLSEHLKNVCFSGAVRKIIVDNQF